MEPLLGVVLAITGACGAVLAVYWGAVLYHIARSMARVPRAPAGLRLPEAGDATLPRVCVVAPAHDEEACIGGLVTSLAAQDYPRDSLGFVLVLDRCRDGTRSAAESAAKGDDRFQIIENGACPEGWAGKTHAIWRGVTEGRAARAADVLLFVDADTTLAPGCVRACTALLAHRRLGMLSLLSTLTTDRWFERVAQPAAAMELLRQYPLVRSNSPNPRLRPFANGQFIMMTRPAYDLVGGHEAVKAALLEDVALARAAHQRGVAIGVFLAHGLLRCRMYASWAEFRRGWKRIYTEGANRKQSRLRKVAWRTRVLGSVLPLAALAGTAAGLLAWRADPEGWGPVAACVGAAGVLVWLAAQLVHYTLGGAPAWAAPSSVAGSWLVGGILHEAAADLERGTPTAWGGMVYAREKR